jgi:hypothetical protein
MMDRVQGFRRGAMIVLVAVSLSGCGGGGGSDDEDPPLPNIGGGTTVVPDLTAQFEAMEARLSPPNVFNTAFLPPDNAIPTSGTATFTGFANVAVTLAGAPLVLTGPATVSIDFGTRNLTGSATGFSGVEGTSVAAYSGTVDFLNGRIGVDQSAPTTQRPNDIRLGYGGVLSGDGNTVGLAGQAEGKLKGSPIRGLVANSAPGETAAVNGALAPAAFTLVAERD